MWFVLHPSNICLYVSGGELSVVCIAPLQHLFLFLGGVECGLYCTPPTFISMFLRGVECGLYCTPPTFVSMFLGG